MRAIAILAGALLFPLLAACGFQPMYGPSTSAVLFQSLQIVSSDTSRTSYLLEDALRRRLEAEEAPGGTAELSVSTQESTNTLGVLLTDRATRADLYLTVRYTLTPRDANGNATKPLSGTLTSVATYNIPSSPYAEITALADARKRAAEDVADRIARDVAFRLDERK
jgi:LPS-assembly lipoprotein